MRNKLVRVIRVPLGLAGLMCALAALHSAAVLGATNEEALKLRPPRGEIPPSFWDQHGTLLIVLGVAAVIGTTWLIWYVARPKRIVPLPPQVRARNELQALAGKTVDRNILSQISRILKRYCSEAFGLSLAEMTTAEFCRAMTAKMEIEAGLAEKVGRFLRKTDGLKFAPGPMPEGCVAEAMELLEQAEAKRTNILPVRTSPGPAIERSKA